MKRVVALLTLGCFFLFGCHILFQHTSLEVDITRPGKTEHVSASAAMQAWAAYVQAKHPSLEKEKQVQAAYDRYHQAQLVLLDATKTYLAVDNNSSDKEKARLDAAIAETSSALTDLIKLIRRFGVKL
jgi:hypothetical protein